MYFGDRVSDELERKVHLLQLCSLLKLFSQQLGDLADEYDYKQFLV